MAWIELDFDEVLQTGDLIFFKGESPLEPAFHPQDGGCMAMSGRPVKCKGGIGWGNGNYRTGPTILICKNAGSAWRWGIFSNSVPAKHKHQLKNQEKPRNLSLSPLFSQPLPLP